MKKLLLAITSLLLLLSLSSCIFTNFSFNKSKTNDYNWNWTDGFGICTSEEENAAYIAEVYVSKNNSEIICPDEYDGKTITALGGERDCISWRKGAESDPFKFDLRSYVPNYSNDIASFLTLNEKQLVDYLNFENYIYNRTDINVQVKISLPSKIEKIKYEKSVIVHQNKTKEEEVDGKTIYYYDIKIYSVVPYFTISDTNEYFYSKDGKIYDKKTNVLIMD